MNVYTYVRDFPYIFFIRFEEFKNESNRLCNKYAVYDICKHTYKNHPAGWPSILDETLFIIYQLTKF